MEHKIQYKEMDRSISIEENFLNALIEEGKSQKGRFKNIYTYYHLFFILKFYDPHFLTQVRRDYKNDDDGWFIAFHKQFRQIDMFDGIGFYDRAITNEEDELRKNLMIELNGGMLSTTEEDREEYVKKVEQLKRLNTLYNRYEMKEHFGGHMDMIMYSVITQDSDNTLFRFMKGFMEKYLKQKK